MSSVAGLVMAFWLGLAPSGGENWRAMYALTRSRVYQVRCGIRQGAGFLYRTNRTIVTSLSVAGCGRDIVIYRYPGDKGITGKLKSYRSKYDIAVVEAKVPLKGPPLEPSNDFMVSIGQRVALIGHPYNPKGTLIDKLKDPLGWSINVGILGRVSKDYVQVQIHRVPGYAGAPVLDRRGRVIGLLTIFGPGGKPIGMCARLRLIDSLFQKKVVRQGWPFLNFELHLHARFSIAIGDPKYTNISPSNQELRLDLIFLDQWNLGIFVGFDLLGLRTDLSLSVLGGFALGYRFLMPRFARPYLNYISLEAGVLFMLLQVVTSGKDIVNDLKVIEPDYGASLWLGLRFYSIAGQFSVGVFFDARNLADPTTPVVPVISFSWGV